MSDAGAEHLAGLRADLHCQGCNYNLRGLEGTVVICPECGISCDVEAILSRKWEIPWHKAPGLNALAEPAAAAVAGLAVALPGIGAMSASGFETLTPVLMLLPLAAWAGYTARLVSLSGAEAGWISVGVTLLVPVFAIALLITILSGVTTVGLLLQGESEEAAIMAGITAVAAGLVFLCRRAEVSVARWCIRRHLDGKLLGVRMS